MKAIYNGRLATITDTMSRPGGNSNEDGAILDEELWVAFGDPNLVVDPTDDQVEAALLGLPIPADPELDAEIAAMARYAIRTGRLPR